MVTMRSIHKKIWIGKLQLPFLIPVPFLHGYQPWPAFGLLRLVAGTHSRIGCALEPGTKESMISNSSLAKIRTAVGRRYQRTHPTIFSGAAGGGRAALRHKVDQLPEVNAGKTSCPFWDPPAPLNCVDKSPLPRQRQPIQFGQKIDRQLQGQAVVSSEDGYPPEGENIPADQIPGLILLDESSKTAPYGSLLQQAVESRSLGLEDLSKLSLMTAFARDAVDCPDKN